MKTIVLCLLAAVGCSKASGRLTGNPVRCELDGTDKATVRGCLPAFERFAAQHPDDRVADVTLLYGPIEAELVVWTTDDKHWPKLRDVKVANLLCGGSNQPNCKDALESRSREPHRQLFVAMLVDVHEKASETTGLLDFYTAENNTGPVTVVEIACRVKEGDDMYTDPQHQGVMRAELFKAADFTATAGSLCLPALYNYFRANPDQHIKWIAQHDHASSDLSFPGGTASLLVALDVTGRSPTPRDLVVYDHPAGDADDLIRFRTERQALFSFPIADRIPLGVGVDQLLVVSTRP